VGTGPTLQREERHDMKYKYSDSAGYYGNGGWIVFSYDFLGHMLVYKVFSTEQECIDCGATRELS